PALPDSSPAEGALERQAAMITEQIEAIKAKIAETTVHGQELAALQRDYDAVATAYHDMLSKQLSAQLHENLEKRHQDGRLWLLEPANLPHRPERPNRIALLAGGWALSVIGALALPFGLYLTDTSFKSADELTRELGVPVASVIPHLQSQGARRLATLRVVAVSSIGIMLSAAVIWAHVNNLF